MSRAETARAVVLGALACALGAACALRAPAPPPVPPPRLSELAGRGDAPRRASLQLAIQGLDADRAGAPVKALDFYQRALQVDPGNPWAYLALARHHADGLEPVRALAFLDQAESILRAQDSLSPGAEAHVAGLRGSVLQALGRSDEARPYLQRARALAPTVWSDGRLSPDELR